MLEFKYCEMEVVPVFNYGRFGGYVSLNGLRRMTAAKRTKDKMYLRFSETKGLHYYDISSFTLFVVRSIGIPRIHFP